MTEEEFEVELEQFVSEGKNGLSEEEISKEEKIEFFEGEDREYADKILPGWKFAPTDSEAITHYLSKRVRHKALPCEGIINEVNIYEHHPEQLIEIYESSEQDGNWYFFTKRDRKYPNGSRPDRSVSKVGFWKATGADIPVKNLQGTKNIGVRKNLAFHLGEQGGKHHKTCWLMHEYRIKEFANKTQDSMMLDEAVLCKIYCKDKEKYPLNEPNGNPSVNPQPLNQAPFVDWVPDVADQPQPLNPVPSSQPVSDLVFQPQPSNSIPYTNPVQNQVVRPQPLNQIPSIPVPNQPSEFQPPIVSDSFIDNGYTYNLGQFGDDSIFHQEFPRNPQQFQFGSANYGTRPIQTNPAYYSTNQFQPNPASFSVQPLQSNLTTFRSEPNLTICRNQTIQPSFSVLPNLVNYTSEQLQSNSGSIWIDPSQLNSVNNNRMGPSQHNSANIHPMEPSHCNWANIRINPSDPYSVNNMMEPSQGNSTYFEIPYPEQLGRPDKRRKI